MKIFMIGPKAPYLGGGTESTIANLDLFFIKKGFEIVNFCHHKESFENIDRWIEELRSYSGDVPCVILANKNDLVDERQIMVNDGEKKAQEYSFDFFETSAKTGESVQTAFNKLAERIVYLLKNPKLREEMGREGRNYILKKFDAKKIYDQLENLFEKLLAES